MRDVDVPANVARRLRSDTRSALEREGGERPGDGADPRPGDLYVLPATAEHDVEWLLAARRGDAVLAVPADPGVEAGSGDVEVPGDEPGGPLILHCRAAVWGDAALLAGGHRSGRLAPRWAEAAHRRWRQVESGSVHGSPLERETDADPAYRDRAEELAAARDALLRHAAAREHEGHRARFRRPPGSPTWLQAAAAVLLVALVGAVWWGSDLQQRVEELSGPRPVLNAGEFRVGSQERGAVEIRRSSAAEDLIIHLVRATGLPAGRYRAVLVAAGDRPRTLWTVPFRFDELGEARLVFPAPPPGLYALRIEDTGAEPPRRVDEHPFRILPPQ